MARYKIVYERSGCIGAATCVAANPKLWGIKDALNFDEVNTLKADLKDSKEVSTGVFERVIEESELKENLDAAQGCPVNVIHIFNLETGERII